MHLHEEVSDGGEETVSPAVQKGPLCSQRRRLIGLWFDIFVEISKWVWGNDYGSGRGSPREEYCKVKMYVKYEIQTPLQKLGKKEFVRKDIIFSYSKRCYENCKLVQGIEKPTGPP